ncbi:MAG: hypothetical protein C0625_09245 [Arcobacter sp.]|nr:MAG: hypothetical protein C0625_09245 [Arcobacter sp.]
MKNFKIYILTKIVPFFLQLFVRFIFITSKKRFHYANIDSNETLLIAMWHGDLLMQPLNYRKFRKNGSVKVIVSEHKDGLIIKKVCEYLGVDGIAGSSSKGAIKALKNAIKEIKNGGDVAITPDGPRGPRFSVADGIVAISKKTNTRIVSLNSIPQKYWQVNSWDKFVIPKPFGTIDFYVSEPFDVNELDMDEAKELIREKMLKNAMK